MMEDHARKVLATLGPPPGTWLTSSAKADKLKPFEGPMDCAPVAQMDRATDYESVGRVFESPRAHHVFNFNGFP